VHVTLIRFLVKSDRSVFSFYGLWKAASPSQPYWHWRLRWKANSEPSAEVTLIITKIINIIFIIDEICHDLLYNTITDTFNSVHYSRQLLIIVPLLPLPPWKVSPGKILNAQKILTLLLSIWQIGPLFELILLMRTLIRDLGCSYFLPALQAIIT